MRQQHGMSGKVFGPFPNMTREDYYDSRDGNSGGGEGTPVLREATGAGQRKTFHLCLNKM